MLLLPAALEAGLRLAEALEALFFGAAFLVPRAADLLPRAEDLVADLVALFPVDFFAAALEAPFFDGTFSPFSLASESPMATACLREVTFLPLPLRSSPCFISCIASFTFLPAPFEYFAIIEI